MNDVDTFFAAHNAENGFQGINLGNMITINDGTYNAVWEVAGFNLENNATASDGTTYSNGKGMLMIPKTRLATDICWHSDGSVATSYINSDMHTITLPTLPLAATNLKSILGSHMINRNVLLGSAQDGTSPRNWITNGYTWTTSDLTTMSIGQMNGGAFARYQNKYDDGEANYKLPVFDHESCPISLNYWARGVYGKYSSTSRQVAYGPHSNNTIDFFDVANTVDIRPLMLLR